MIPICLAMLSDDTERVYFLKLYSEYETMMYQVALSVLHDSSLAEDAVQESWLRVAIAFYKILNLEWNSVKGYLTILVKNVCIDFNRRETLKEELPKDWDISNVSSQGNVLDMIVDLIRTMPVQYREILERKYILGYSNREIGRSLGLKESTVATRAMRGRIMLADFLREEGFSESGLEI